jgi:hypothetical protein
MPGIAGNAAMTAGLSTLGVGFGESARQQVCRDGEAPEYVKLALAPSCGLRAFGLAIHLAVIVLQEEPKCKRIF